MRFRTHACHRVANGGRRPLSCPLRPEERRRERWRTAVRHGPNGPPNPGFPQGRTAHMDVNAAWYFDFVSPFAYLQWRRFERQGVRGLQHLPILFAGLLDQLGTKGPAEIASKRTFTYRHVIWRAQQDKVKLTFPPAHPFNPLPALRLCIAAGATTAAVDTVFRHLWQEGNAIETPQEVDAMARRLGFSDAHAALADRTAASKLRENFARAREDGVFGVPTIVCNGHLFWGDDATGMFLDYLRDPEAFDSGPLGRIAHLPVGRSRLRANPGDNDQRPPATSRMEPVE